jgi:NAD(P)-dependent dehydrogenase (short-subunit alcohol dehydrogenase family)
MKNTALITGATSGLGCAAALALGKQGWRVLVVGRDPARGQEVVTQIAAAGGEAEFLAADLFSLADVRRLASEVEKRAPELHLLVNNAGGTFGARELTVDGLEKTFALNVVTPFVLTEGLIKSLSAAKGRVVNVATGVPSNTKAAVDDLPTGAAGLGGYTRAKLAVIALTKEQQQRLAPWGITVVSIHPGIIPNTRFGEGVMPAAVRALAGGVAKVFGVASTLDQAAQRYLAAGTGAVEPGAHYAMGSLNPGPALANEQQFRSALWSKLTSLTHSPGSHVN